jgi:hypothetical protein
VHVQDKHVQVLHNAALVAHLVHKVHVLQMEHLAQEVQEVQVDPLHIVQVLLAHQIQVAPQLAVNHLVKVRRVINVVVQLVLSESRRVNLVRRTRVRKRCVKSSTIWLHQVLVAQSFHEETERL